MCICRAGRHGFVILNAVFRVGEGFKYVLDLVMATGIQTTTIGARDRQWARNHATHIRVQIHVCRPCQLHDTCIMRFLKYSFNVESILFVGAHCLGFRWYPLPKNSHPRELIYNHLLTVTTKIDSTLHISYSYRPWTSVHCLFR